MTPFLALTWLVICALGVWGGRPERIAAILFAALHLATPLIEHLTIGQVRWAVAITSLVMTAGLLWLALTRDRWWLVFAAGCQLLALSTHALALLRFEGLIWAAVTIRWISWGGVLACALFGLWEARALARLRHSSRGPHAEANSF